MALLSTIRDLHRRKGRERRGLALAEGVRLVEEMLAAPVPCKGVVVSPALETTPRGVALLKRLRDSGPAPETVSDADLAELASTEHPQGVIAVFQPHAWTIDSLAPRAGAPLVILDAVQDPGNVGSIARTARAFGASGLLALPGTADLTNPKAIRGAMGALFHLPHAHGTEADALQLQARTRAELWVTDMSGEPLAPSVAGVPIAVVFGNEGAGVQPGLLARATRRVMIPIRPGTESLNVAVATGIVLHEVTR